MKIREFVLKNASYCCILAIVVAFLAQTTYSCEPVLVIKAFRYHY